MNKADHVEGLNAIVKEYTKLSDSLQLNLKTRIAETTNSDIRQRLVNASETIR